MVNYIYHDKDCVFMHLTKCGGQYVTRSLLPSLSGYNIGENVTFGNNLPPETSGYYFFTMARDPYTRIVSAYRMFKYGTDIIDPTASFSGVDFSSFIQTVVEYSANTGIPYTWAEFDPSGIPLSGGLIQGIENVIKFHTLPQTHQYNIPSGVTIHYTGFYENFFPSISGIISGGLSGVSITGYEKINVTNYAETYVMDSGLLSSINNLYDEDFSRFGYAKEYFYKEIVYTSGSAPTG